MRKKFTVIPANALSFLLVLLTCSLLCCTAVSATDRMQKFCAGITDTLLQEQFPYLAYAEAVEFHETVKLEADARYLEKVSAYAVEVYDSLFTLYSVRNPLPILPNQALHRHTATGIALLNTSTLALQIQGDKLLQQICEEIEKRLQAETMETDDPEVIKLIATLEAQQYLVTPPVPSDSEKLLRNLQNAEFGYIWARFKSRCMSDCAFGACNKMCLVFYLLSLAGLLLIAGWIVHRIRMKKKMA